MGIDHKGQICVMIHSGSRGLGHQVATGERGHHINLILVSRYYYSFQFFFFFSSFISFWHLDALVAMEKAMKRDKITVNDRQLACARITSPEGQDYLKGMAAAGNYAWVNRSSMTFLTRQVSWTLTGNKMKYRCTHTARTTALCPILSFALECICTDLYCRRSPKSSIPHQMIWTCTSSMTSHTTSPRWKSTWWTANRRRFLCTERDQHEPSHHTIHSYLLTTRWIRECTISNVTLFTLILICGFIAKDSLMQLILKVWKWVSHDIKQIFQCCFLLYSWPASQFWSEERWAPAVMCWRAQSRAWQRRSAPRVTERWVMWSDVLQWLSLCLPVWRVFMNTVGSSSIQSQIQTQLGLPGRSG